MNAELMTQMMACGLSAAHIPIEAHKHDAYMAFAMAIMARFSDLLADHPYERAMEIVLQELSDGMGPAVHPN